MAGRLMFIEIVFMFILMLYVLPFLCLEPLKHFNRSVYNGNFLLLLLLLVLISSLQFSHRTIVISYTFFWSDIRDAVKNNNSEKRVELSILIFFRGRWKNWVSFNIKQIIESKGMSNTSISMYILLNQWLFRSIILSNRVHTKNDMETFKSSSKTSSEALREGKKWYGMTMRPTGFSLRHLFFI